MSETEAEAQWARWEMMRAADPTSIIWDMDGPTKAPLQFRVATGKRVDFGSEYAHQKLLESTQKLKRNMQPEETPHI